MNKILHSVLFMVLFILITIELGMRLSIWYSLNKTVPDSVEFKMYVTIDKNISLNWCSTDSRENYQAVFYTVWILLRMKAASVCQYQSPHITLMVNTDTSASSYHWSFYDMGFIKDNE